MVQWFIKVIYKNEYFPFPEYNFARFAICLAYILWGAITLSPGNPLKHYPLFLLLMPAKAWGVFSICFGLFLFWRIAELKAPTKYCSWINLVVASSWWIFCIMLVFSRGFIPIGISGNLIVALIATYVYVTTKVEHS